MTSRHFLTSALLLLGGMLAGVKIAPRVHAPVASEEAVGPPALQSAPESPSFSQLPDFSSIARLATPAVVNIAAIQVVRRRDAFLLPFFSDPFFREFFGDYYPYRIPREERQRSLGSGVIVRADGIILTNYHVVGEARELEITLANRRRYAGRLEGVDPPTDLAVVRIAANGLAALPWGDSDRIRVGDWVLAIGNPFQLNQTVTMGIVSAVGRANVGIADYEDFIQTDAAINPGNSGGGLVNIRGELIGINTAILSESGGYQGIGFAVPSNLAQVVLESVLRHGRVLRGWSGITRLGDVTQEAADQLGLKEPAGALILALVRGGPADRAGIEPGDVVLAVEGKEILDAGQLRNALGAAAPGARLRLRIFRAGRILEIALEVEEAR